MACYYYLGMRIEKKIRDKRLELLVQELNLNFYEDLNNYLDNF